MCHEKTIRRSVVIDVFRALTMFFMLMVNELGGIDGIPQWVDHVEYGVDGLGFADTVFPAFMFIVGLSLPFAIRKHMREGRAWYRITGHIVYRSFALLLMGFYHVNMASYHNNSPLPVEVWGIVITVMFFFIWLDYPAKMSILTRGLLIATGYIGLFVMAYLYSDDKHIHFGMRPQWWGILGIIGWGYLVSGLVYYLAKGRLAILSAILFVFAVINICSHMNLVPFNIWLIGDASSVTLMIAGAVTGLLYHKYQLEPYKLITLFFVAATLLVAGGFIVRPLTGGISKIGSTPAWVFICTGISLAVLAVLIFLVDVKQKQQWFRFIMPAGTATLVCYLLPDVIGFLMMLLHIHFPDYFEYGLGGFLRSLFLTFLVIFIAGRLAKAGIKLKL